MEPSQESDTDSSQQEENEITLCSLPILVQSRILSFLPRSSINSLSTTCRLWRKSILESPKQCRKNQFLNVTVKSRHEKFVIAVRDEEGIWTKRDFPLDNEDDPSQPRTKRRRIEESEEKNEDVRSGCTPQIMRRLEKIASIGDVKRLSMDAIDITEETIDRIVEVFTEVDELEIQFMDLQRLSNEKVRKLIFGLGNTKLSMSLTWIGSQQLDDSFWKTCGDQLKVLNIDTVQVKNRRSGIPLIREDEFIRLCERIPTIRFGVSNELKPDTILQIIEKMRDMRRSAYYRIDYDNPIFPFLQAVQYLQLNLKFVFASSHTLHYSDLIVPTITVEITTNTQEITIRKPDQI